MAEWRSLYFSVVSYFNRRFVIDYCRINDKHKPPAKLLFYSYFIIKLFWKYSCKLSGVHQRFYQANMKYNFESLEIFALICSQIDLFQRERNFYDVEGYSFSLSYSLLFVILPASALITRNQIWWVNMLILLYKTLRTSHVPL